VPEISPADAKQLIESGAQLIDVRTDAEYEAGHIPGSQHVPLADLQPEVGGLEREQALVIYCRSGDRSGLAADAFAASGWDAHSITGGLEAWQEEGFPLEPADGTVAHTPGLPPP
jgi:rhodanese-related sulfurtransferase